MRKICRTRIRLNLILILGAAGALAAAPQTTPAAGPSRVVLTVDKPSFFLGENVLVHYCLENTSSAALTISYGGDYRGGSRSQRFKVIVTDASGNTAPDPDPAGYNEGGLGGDSTVAPGGRWCQSLPLMRYARIDSPGIYDIRVTHDLGWPKGQATEGQTKVTLAMPTAIEAEQVIAAMAALPTSGVVMGRLSKPYQDFTTLRYGIYLEPLLQRAKAGTALAITGIGSIPTPEATEALIGLLTHPNPAVAQPAAQVLAMRLPDPELKGELAPRNILMNDLASPRAYLRNASWRPSFAPEVRADARKLLAAPEVQDVVEGAFFLEAVGEAADAPDLSAALTRAIEKTLTLPFETGNYPRPRGAARELMRAADMIVARGYAPPPPKEAPGDFALWLVAFGRGLRPDGWQDTMGRALAHRIPYLREIALDRMPDSVPEALISAVGANLDASDIDVQIAACHVVERGKVVSLRAPVTAIAKRATEFWLLNAAQNALFALGRSPVELLENAAARLVEPDVATQMLETLIGAFDSDGMSSTEVIPPDEARALSLRWIAFIDAHRSELDTGQPLSLDRTDIPSDLLPPGWKLFRTGKPSWPPGRP